MRVDEVIAAYLQAREDDDRVRASRLLESLEGEQYANEADWERIRAFCAAEGFDARLEIITKKLIKIGQARSAGPFIVLSRLLVKSGRAAEAKPFLDQYRKISDGRDSGQWDLVNVFFEIGDFRQCLDATRNVLALTPEAVPFLITEARALEQLGESRAARRKLRELQSKLGTHAGNWIWFTVLANEFNEPEVAASGVRRLLELLGTGATKLSAPVIYALEQAGEGLAVKRLLAAAEPALYHGVEEYLEIFEAALRYGTQQSALRFGLAILKVDPEHTLKNRVERLAAGPEFLMS